MIGIMNIKLNKLKTRNDKLTRSNKNLKEEREMFMDSNQRLVGVNKKKEVEVNLLTSQLNMSMGKKTYQNSPLTPQSPQKEQKYPKNERRNPKSSH